jgi:hypothetical protein
MGHVAHFRGDVPGISASYPRAYSQGHRKRPSDRLCRQVDEFGTPGSEGTKSARNDMNAICELTRRKDLDHEIAAARRGSDDGRGNVAGERRIGQFTRRITRIIPILPAETLRDEFGT